MVMAYFGADVPTQENALAIYDEEHDMFGNWGRAVQRAGEMGLDAWLQRFRNWDQVKAMIARGQPIVAGIKTNPALSNISAKVFDVMPTPSAITRAPLRQAVPV